MEEMNPILKGLLWIIAFPIMVGLYVFIQVVTGGK